MVSNSSAVVKPMPQASVKYKQSRYDLPRLPLRCQIVGRSSAGKGTLIASMLQDQYANCFEAVHVFSSTIDVDPLWVAMVDHIQETLGQSKHIKDLDDIPIGFDTIDEAMIRKNTRERGTEPQKTEGRGRETHQGYASHL